jgi:hypothetical protein
VIAAPAALFPPIALCRAAGTAIPPDEGERKVTNKFITIWAAVLVLGAIGLIANAGKEQGAQVAAASPEHKITVGEYKAKARAPSYEQLARYPQDYLKTIVQLEGKVVQAGDGFLRVDVNAHVAWLDRIDAGLTPDAIVYVSYKHKPGDSRILEGDKVRFWGRYDGIVSYKAVLGQTIAVPNVAAEIVEDNGVFENPKLKPRTSLK